MADVHGAPRYRWVILGLTIICQTTVALGGLALGPLAPLFQPELGLSKTEVGLLASTISLGAWIVMLAGGSLTDRFGIRALTTLGQVVRGAPLLCMTFAASLPQTVAVLFTVGIGGGLVLPGPTKAIMEWFPRASRATAMGLKQTGTPIAGMLNASLLPVLGLALGWRAALSVVGLVIMAGGIATLLLYRDPPHLKQIPRREASMKVGLSEVLRNRPLWTIGSMGFLFSAVQLALMNYLALYFAEIVLVPVVPDRGARVVAAGGYLALCQMGGLLGRVFWGVVSDRILGGRRAMALGFIGALSAVASAALGLLDSEPPVWLLSVVAFVAGICIIGWNGVYHALVTETTRRKYAATAVGLSMTLIELGIMIGPPLFGLVVDASGSYRVGWLFFGCLSAGVTVPAYLVARAAQQGE